MQYELTKKQIISEANKIRSEFRIVALEKSQKRYLNSLIKDNKKNFILLITLTIIEVLIGIALPIISHFYLEESFDLMNYRTFLIVGISLCILIVLFLINSFFRIYATQKLSMDIMNDIREAWYSYYLKHTDAFKPSFDGKKLITKFLYHIQLFKLGINNVLSNGMETIFMYIAIILFALFFNSKLFVVLWLSAPLFVIIFLITDFIGRHYITREQTFNSRIVEHLADSMFNFSLIKSQGREKEKLMRFENIIDIDAFFRIRRQLWIQYSNRILYAIILLVGVCFYFVQIYWPFIEFDSLTNLAATGIILGYFVKILYSTARVGIFYEAYRLGLSLVIPKFPYKFNRIIKNSPEWDTLRLHSKKIKISKFGSYIKKFDLKLEKSKKYLIYSEGSYGKSTIAKLIAGKKVNPSLVVNADKKRLTTEQWATFKSSNFFISDSINYEISIAEFLFGKGVDDISRKDIHGMIEIFKQHKIFNFMFDHREFIGRKILTDLISKTENILMQIAHCIINPKKIISIDHSCLEDPDKKIIKALDLLIEKCPQTTIVAFSKKPNTYLKYDKTFELNKAEFKEV